VFIRREDAERFIEGFAATITAYASTLQTT
jgi:hypothetical protein